MTKLRKKGDTFDREKLLRSIKTTGTTDAIARRIANAIEVTENMRTLDIANHVISELKKTDPDAAKEYKKYREEKYRNK